MCEEEREVIVYHSNVRIKKTGRTGLVIDDEYVTPDGKRLYLIEPDVRRQNEPITIGAFREDFEIID